MSYPIPAGIFLFKVNNGNIRTICEICLKLTIKNDVILVSFFQLLTDFTHSSNSCDSPIDLSTLHNEKIKYINAKIKHF